MSSAFSPPLSCALAISSYQTLGARQPNIAVKNSLDKDGFGEEFDINSGSVFTGKTGLGESSNFGYVANGKGSRQGEVVIAIRGTTTTSDWLTDFHISTARSATGYPVHAGFCQLADTLLPQIRTSLAGKNPGLFHVVGHSLGGAVATLVADVLRGMADVKLYTIGAPRTSYSIHVDYLTQRLGKENIYRAFHDTDPVPMIPIFPYRHAPSGGPEYLLPGTGAIIWPAAHYKETYRKTMVGSWGSLPRLQHRRFSLETVDDVLEMAGNIPGGFLSAPLLRLIVKALDLILAAVGGAVGLAMLGASTVLDQIAHAIAMGFSAASAGKDMVQSLIAQIMRWLGLVVVEGVNITLAFLRWLLGKLFATIAQMAVAATNRLV